jgi:hypothetical protein
MPAADMAGGEKGCQKTLIRCRALRADHARRRDWMPKTGGKPFMTVIRPLDGGFVGK